ncbi:hypothetical protein GE061_005626 [Apolygus lucorum]|uniref:Uncharacterized protein n=1 Tax=Apolygus lucorum TaxID=248454 RepID=A0A6A4IQY1_APOLU|nr:hypothetical protein GE061_005626 [Apolygus lucorum]
MEWSEKLTLEFLNLFAKEPIIWDPHHPGHKDRNVVHDGWKRIQNQLSTNYSVAELKKKRENLMATYRKCVKKIENSSYGGTNDVYKPEWFAFEKMESFLRSIYTPKSKLRDENVIFQINSMKQDEEVKREPEDECDDTMLSYSSQRSNEENPLSPVDRLAVCDDENMQPSAADNDQQYDPANGDPVATSPTHQYADENFRLTSSPSPSIRIAEGSSTRMHLKKSTSINNDDPAVQRPSKRQRLDDEDRFDLIGRTFAMKMRGLPKNQMLIAERLMNETLFRAEMGLLTLNYRLAGGA